MQIIVRPLKLIRMSKFEFKFKFDIDLFSSSFFELDHRFADFFAFEAATREHMTGRIQSECQRKGTAIRFLSPSSALGKSIFFMNKIDIYSRDIHSLILSTFMYVIILVGRRRNAKPKLINGIVVQLSSVSCRAQQPYQFNGTEWNSRESVMRFAYIRYIHFQTHTRRSPLTPISPRTHNIQFRLSVFGFTVPCFSMDGACAYEFGQTVSKNERFATASFISNKCIDVMGSRRYELFCQLHNFTYMRAHIFIWIEFGYLKFIQCWRPNIYLSTKGYCWNGGRRRN